MLVVAALREHINKRRDIKIIDCLRDHGAMTESDLQKRTGIALSALRHRLYLLHHSGWVSQEFHSTMSVWKIHHPHRL